LRKFAVVLLLGVAIAAGAQEPLDEAAVSQGQLLPQMPDEVRDTVSRIVILPTAGQSGESITGTYDEETLGLQGGMARGAGIGTVPVEVGHVPINIPIPIVREIGMIVGGIAGHRQRTVQDMRDRMVDDLARAVDQPLSNIALATDVYWGLRNVATVQPKLFAQTTPIPKDTDAILFVHLDQLTLNVQEDEVIVSTAAVARVQRYSDGTTLYRATAQYEDRDTLKNWARDDYALWRAYGEYARHYIARELTAILYERVAVSHELMPAPHESIKPDKKDDWAGKTRSLTPTLAWDFELLGSSAATDGAAIAWDIEIFDEQRPVYQAQQIQGTQHTPAVPLEPCKTYRWSVRPTYTRDGVTRNGTWMRKGVAGAQSNGNSGRAISVAHAYVQDFAVLQVDCKAR
jgi:hypothetical protein